MGFSCALALVVPSVGTINDYSISPDAIPSDIFSTFIANPVPVKWWHVVKFINFGDVRALEKANSSLSPSARASGSSGDRAAKCAASFLLGKYFAHETAVRSGDRTAVVPFVADHVLIDQFCDPDRRTEFSFRALFDSLHANDVIDGLYALRDWRGTPTPESIFQGVLWMHNTYLRDGDAIGATILEECSPVGLLWVPAEMLADWMTDLLSGASVESVELAKDPIARTFAETWRYLFQCFAEHDAKVIMLTGRLHSECCAAIRRMPRYL
jgi:hypothetical protein